MPRHPFSPSSLVAGVLCIATPVLVALQLIAGAPLVDETEFCCQFNVDNGIGYVSTYSFIILELSDREMPSRVDRSYAKTDNLIAERAGLTQPDSKPVSLDQSQIGTRTVPNPDQDFLRERQTPLAFPNLRVSTHISYTLREYFIAKPLSTQFHYILSRPPMPAHDDHFVTEFKAERSIFVRNELMDAYRIEQSVDKKTLKASLKRLQYTNYINEAGNAYLHHTPRLGLGSSLDLQGNSGPFVARYNEVLAAELPKGAAVAVVAVKGKLARERITGLVQYVNDTYHYLGDWCAGEHGYASFFLAEIERNGYGDCKGLAIPFTTMPRVIGIKVEPALVSRSDVVWDLPMPGMYASDHATIRAKVDDKAWWLDPTNPVFAFGRIMPDIQQRWALVLDADGKVRRGEIPLEAPGDTLRVTRGEHYTYDGEARVESRMELSNAPLMQLSVADHQRDRTSTDQGLCHNFAKEDSDCVLERDDSQFVLPPSYTIGARLTDHRVPGQLGEEYFYNRQDLASQWDAFARYRGEDQLIELYLDEPQTTPHNVSLSGDRTDEPAYSCEIRSPWFDIDLQVEPTKDGGYYYHYRKVQKTSWLNHDGINSTEFGKLTEQSRGCVEQLRLVVKLDKYP